MSSGDKMAPFLALEMAWVCHMIFFLSNATFIKTILKDYVTSQWCYSLSLNLNHLYDIIISVFFLKNDSNC